MSEEILRAGHIMKTNPAHQRASCDPMYKSGSAFIKDHYCPLGEAKVPVFSGLVTHSDSVYDALTVSGGAFFRLEYHQDRFARSCDLMRIENPLSREEEAEVLHNLVGLTGLKDAFVMWMVSRELVADRAQSANLEAYTSHFNAFVVDYVWLANDDQRVRGLDFIVSDRYVRVSSKSVDPRAKNFHWLDLQMSMLEAGDRGAEYSVLPDEEGNLTECPGANIFCVKDGELYTPDSGCLEGGTRDSVIELSKDLGLPCHVKKVHRDFFCAADEAFMTSSSGGIMPVNRVNGVLLGGRDGPGDISTRIHNLYWERRWDGWWATPVNYDRKPG